MNLHKDKEPANVFNCRSSEKKIFLMERVPFANISGMPIPVELTKITQANVLYYNR